MRHQYPSSAVRELYNSHAEIRNSTRHGSGASYEQYSGRIELTNRLLSRLAAVSPDRRRRIRLLIGHVPFGVHEMFPWETSYVTMVRDPVKRVLSWYRYVSTHPVYSRWVPRDEDLEQWLHRGDNLQFMNWQCRLLGGSLEGEPRELCERAKENLCSGFAAVGLTERFDESLVLFKRTFGWRDVHYRRLNVTRRPKRPPPVTDRVIDIIESANVFDRELYEFARDRFEDTVRRMEPGFSQEVAVFRQRNRRLDVQARAVARMYGLVVRKLMWLPLRGRLRTLKKRLAFP